jgi:hypothetical protein
VSGWHKQDVGPDRVLRALGAPLAPPEQCAEVQQRSPRSQLVGIGEITDPSHPCVREKVGGATALSSAESVAVVLESDGGSGVYLAFAKAAIDQYTVLGEYTGTLAASCISTGHCISDFYLSYQWLGQEW